MFVSLDSGGVKFIYHARHEKQRKANMIAKLRQHKCQECYQAVVQRGAIFKNKFAERNFFCQKIIFYMESSSAFCHSSVGPNLKRILTRNRKPIWRRKIVRSHNNQKQKQNEIFENKSTQTNNPT